MNVELPLSPEQENNLFLTMIANRTLFMDITFPSVPVPVTITDLNYRRSQGLSQGELRYATQADIPRIRQFYIDLENVHERRAE